MVVDEAGMLGTHDRHRLMQLARQNTWRLVLVGDPHQLQAVGRGGIHQHLETIASYWTECRDHGQSLAITTTRNEHVDLINDRT